ncbi:DUF2263 domain-containing protein [Favolaschia claudopus]|uniref:DUF2263 domain-containing protein n=1 Tax=Favolaschia claudopus TaxID=2862362 RepID=A0AAW0BSI8_9AGAR
MSSRTLNAAPPAIIARPREDLKTIAQQTLSAVKRGFFQVDGDPEGKSHILQDLSSEPNSTVYINETDLDDWETSHASRKKMKIPTRFVVYQATTIEAIRFCLSNPVDSSTSQAASNVDHTRPVILNFASATSPGGSFLAGARAQEESLARSSNLHSSLSSASALPFYAAHRKHPDPRSTHAMVFTRNVRFVRDDAGAWVAPLDVDVLTSAAVNVNALRKSLHIRGEDTPLPQDTAAEVAAIMRERMARILFAMARAGAEDIVLGSFGTGAFRNNVEFVAQTWADLLHGEVAPFKNVFRRVVFAIVDRGTWNLFGEVFEEAGENHE